jgi:hypothetical protein
MKETAEKATIQTLKKPQGSQNAEVKPPMAIAMSHTRTPPALA